MSVQRGRDLLLKLDAAATGTFVTVMGLRARSIALNTREVDITHAESAGRWRELLSGAGAREASIVGSGLFTSSETEKQVGRLFFDDFIRPWELILPELGTIRGPFLLNRLEYAGTYDGEMTYDIALMSAGELTLSLQSE